MLSRQKKDANEDWRGQGTGELDDGELARIHGFGEEMGLA